MKHLKSAGLLNNAPVTYVICKIDCGDLLSFDSYVKEAQELFRKSNFPIFHDQIVKDIRITTDHGIKIDEQEKHTYHFISSDYEDGIVVSGGSLFIQTKNYKDFTKFADLVKKAHEIYSSVTEMNLVRAVGLRYIDLIEPANNQPLSYYLNDSMLSPTFGDQVDITPIEARIQHSYKTPLNSVLFLRLFAGKGHKIVPDDLIPMIEPLFITSGKKEDLSKCSPLSALIDTDHFIQFNPMKDATSFNVAGLLDTMHRYTSHLFCNVVTKEAIEEWK
ncbi:TIGR04255 family protein [uncultured Paraglaciecola sp.]|uniref:TIGR04255 family protein n=1 Tax=uncultured Paraglaciecola sp. TaxID=1765024 RepID=UPI0025918146|nr:TIGR04255 family protein [uncultured Paraglaciecola sp.]